VSKMRSDASRTGYLDPAGATALLALGDLDAAHTWLEEAYRQRHPDLPFVGGDPRFARFADDPRFLDTLQRLGVRRTRTARRD